MFTSIQSHVSYWLFIGIFAATPFFIPQANAEALPSNANAAENEVAAVGVYFGGGGGGRYYGRRPWRYRNYPRGGYYYRYGDPYYYGPYNYYDGPYYRRYNRYPRGGGGVYFRVR